MKKSPSNPGFTLIEILLSLSIVGLLLVLALPLSQAFSNKNHAQLVEQDIRAAIHYARTMAYKNAGPLTLVPLREDHEWSKGLLLLSGKKTIFQWEWQDKNIQVRWKGFRSNDAIYFSNILRQSTANGYFLINTQGGMYQKKIIVNRLGRIADP